MSKLFGKSALVIYIYIYIYTVYILDIYFVNDNDTFVVCICALNSSAFVSMDICNISLRILFCIHTFLHIHMYTVQYV